MLPNMIEFIMAPISKIPDTKISWNSPRGPISLPPSIKTA